VAEVACKAQKTLKNVLNAGPTRPLETQTNGMVATIGFFYTKQFSLSWR
jgi:hypothetical protein